MNSESNRKKPANRWQELAEQLGLSDEISEAPAQPVTPAPAPVEQRAPEVQPPPRPEPAETFAPTQTPVYSHAQETQQAEEGMESDPVAGPPETQFEALADMQPVASESSPDTVLESAADSEGPPQEGEAASPRTAGRRRRRRRSSGKKKDPVAEGTNVQGATEATESAPVPVDAQATAKSTAPSVEAQAAAKSPTPPVEAQAAAIAPAPQVAKAQPPRETSEGESGNQRGRNRSRGGRRRREEEPEVVEEPSPDEDEVHESGGLVGLEDDDEDDGEIPDYSNWTVPSWKELIGSLYRPER